MAVAYLRDLLKINAGVPPFEPVLAVVLALPLLLAMLFLSVGVGLVRRSRVARRLSIVTSFMIAAASPVLGAVLVMYLIRPGRDLSQAPSLAT